MCHIWSVLPLNEYSLNLFCYPTLLRQKRDFLLKTSLVKGRIFLIKKLKQSFYVQNLFTLPADVLSVWKKSQYRSRWYFWSHHSVFICNLWDLCISITATFFFSISRCQHHRSADSTSCCWFRWLLLLPSFPLVWSSCRQELQCYCLTDVFHVVLIYETQFLYLNIIDTISLVWLIIFNM